MQVDYIVVGQGLCGSFMSRELQQAGKSFVVIDEHRPYAASRVASGVINPVTGRQWTKTWMIHDLLPFAAAAYKAMEADIDQSIISDTGILLFHTNPATADGFQQRYAADPEFLSLPDAADWAPYFYTNYGVAAISPAYYIDLTAMLTGWRSKLQSMHCLRAEAFDPAALELLPNQVRYHDIIAEKIIFCNGVDAFDYPWWSRLPYSRNKGEAIIAAIPGLPHNRIYKQGLTIVPWNDGLFWIGSTYEWKFEHVHPTEQFRQKVADQLTNWLKLPYQIVDHMAALRPATVERRPFVGVHPLYPSLAILNGTGTKGCSLAPFFAAALRRHLLDETPITPAADVNRFRRVLGA